MTMTRSDHGVARADEPGRYRTSYDVAMTSRLRDPLVSLDVKANVVLPSLHSPKLSPSILRRGGKSSKKFPISSSSANPPRTSTFSVTLLSTEPWSPLSATSSSAVADQTTALTQIHEEAHSVVILNSTAPGQSQRFQREEQSAGDEGNKRTTSSVPLALGSSDVATFAILYCVWTPEISWDVMESRIVASWKEFMRRQSNALPPKSLNGVQARSIVAAASEALYSTVTTTKPVSKVESDATTICDDVATGSVRGGGDESFPTAEPSLVTEEGEAKIPDYDGENEPSNLGFFDDTSDNPETLRCQVYLVIDQVLVGDMHFDGGSGRRNPNTTDGDAKLLAKALAASCDLRLRCQGVSICVSNAPPASSPSAAQLLAATANGGAAPAVASPPALPGLALIAQALQLGTRQRRSDFEQRARASAGEIPLPPRSAKSLISVVVAGDSRAFDVRADADCCDAIINTESDTVVTFQDDADVDSDDDVRQSSLSRLMPYRSAGALPPPLSVTVVAEWNGRGNLLAFANRAHASWRLSMGLPPEPKPPAPARKIPRRIRRARPLPTPAYVVPPVFVLPASDRQYGTDGAGYTETSRTRKQEQLVQDCVAMTLVLCYLWFHFADDCRNIMWFLFAPSGHAEMVQYLREWR